MATLDRRRFLCSAATAAALYGVSGVSGYGGVGNDGRAGWERVDADRSFSSFSHALPIEEGTLLVGTTRDGTDPSEGWATTVTAGGDAVWDRRYPSPDQVETLESGIQGPIPQDGFSCSVSTDDGYLLVGWTYYDSTAVYVGRLVRVDAGGAVQWERSLSALEDTSAYSYLADGIQTDDGYLLCGMESPGIMLGGGGWLVSVAADGSVNWHRRYPATERNLEETSRRDVFTSITETAGGYVLSGYYEPDDTGRSRGWMVGLDESGAVRWDDRFDLGADGSTRTYDVVQCDDDEYDLLVVGAAGPAVDRGRQDHMRPQDPAVEGDGFVAAYTDDGERVQFDRLEDTPLFCAVSGPTGAVAGGARGERAWVGSLDRTYFQADRPSVVGSLCEAHDGGVIAAGRRFTRERTEGWARHVGRGIDKKGQTDRDADDTADSDEKRTDERADDEGNGDDGTDDRERTDDREETGDDHETGDDREQKEDEEPDDRTIEFVDCQTIRVVGDFADVIVGLSFEAADGDLGTITEPVGGVEGERTIHGPSAFGLETDAAVVTYAEGFDETPSTPGLGALSVENPDLEACERNVLGDLVADGSGDEDETDTDTDGSIEFLDCETVRVTGDFDDVLLSFAWWTEEGLVGTISEPVGGVDGERTISASGEFGPFPYGPVLSSVEAFETGTASPGMGDLSRQNPEESTCIDDVFARLEADGVELEDAGSGGGDAGSDSGSGSDSESESDAESAADSDSGPSSESDSNETDDRTADSSEETDSESETTGEGDENDSSTGSEPVSNES